MNIELTEKERLTVIKEATSQLVRELITNHGAAILLSTAQAAGYLNVTTQTLRKLPITSYDVTGRGGTLCFRIRDLEDYLESRKIL